MPQHRSQWKYSLILKAASPLPFRPMWNREVIPKKSENHKKI